MNLKLYLLFFLILVLSEVRGSEKNISGNVSCFVPIDNRFKKIYHENPFYQIDYSMELKKDVLTPNSAFFFFGSIGYLYGSGRTNQGSHTHIHYVPLSFGGNILFRLKGDKVRPYAGIGPVVVYSKVHNDVGEFCSLDKKQNGWGWGGRLRSGFFAEFAPSFALNFFVDYYLTKIFYQYNNNAIKHQCFVQGISIGAGLGYKF